MSAEINRLVPIIEDAIAKTIGPNIVPMADRQGVDHARLMFAMSIALMRNAVGLAAAAVRAPDETAEPLRVELQATITAWIEKHGTGDDD